MATLPSPIRNGDDRNVIFSKFNDLLKYLQTTRIVPDNKTLQAAHTPGGIVLRSLQAHSQFEVEREGGDEESACGYFRAALSTDEDTGTLSVRIEDGADPETEYCGYVDTESARLWVEPAELEIDTTAADDLAVWLTLRDNGEELSAAFYVDEEVAEPGTDPDYDPDAASESLQSSGDVLAHVLIARVIYDPDEDVRHVVQEQHGPIYVRHPEYRGAFAVTRADNGLYVTGGPVLLNGTETIQAEDTELKKDAGTICVCVNFSNGWGEPEIKFAQPGANAWPVAQVVLDDDQMRITQYPCGMALVFHTAECPIAVAAQKEQENE